MDSGMSILTTKKPVVFFLGLKILFLGILVVLSSYFDVLFYNNNNRFWQVFYGILNM